MTEADSAFFVGDRVESRSVPPQGNVRSVACDSDGRPIFHVEWDNGKKTWERGSYLRFAAKPQSVSQVASKSVSPSEPCDGFAAFTIGLHLTMLALGFVISISAFMAPDPWRGAAVMACGNISILTTYGVCRGTLSLWGETRRKCRQQDEELS